MTRWLALAVSAIVLGGAAPAFAEKCPFSAPQDPHERDENDPPLRCRKCEEIAAQIAKRDQNVWTLGLKYGHPRRVEVKRETKQSEVYWFLYYELTNEDTVPHPCFVDVHAESDKGKNTYTYHDLAVPEVVEEVRRIVGIKDGEQLYTQADLCMPEPGTENKLPNKDGTVLDQTYEDGKALTDPRTGRPSVVRFLERNTDKDGKPFVIKDGPARPAFSVIKPKETRRCAAIFKKIDAEMDVLTVFFSGLTNTIWAAPDARYPAQNPEASPVGEGDFRIINDNIQDFTKIGEYRRRAIERIFVLEYECLGDEFSKSSRSILVHDEQLLRPVNLAKDETDPVKYHDVGIFGTEIVEPEEKTVEGKKAIPYTFLGRKWIQTERTIKSDLR